MTYEYDDDFLIGTMSPEQITKIEDDALIEVVKLKIEDDYYKEKIVISSVYAEIALQNLEADGMQDKHSAYNRQKKDYIKLSSGGNIVDSSISSVPIFRG